jgi:hypothetical protein
VQAVGLQPALRNLDIQDTHYQLGVYTGVVLLGVSSAGIGLLVGPRRE